MKITNYLVGRFGADKLLHCSFAGWIVAMSGLFGWLVMLIVTIVVFVLSIIKERFLDEGAEKKDTLASCIGMAISWWIYIISTIV